MTKKKTAEEIALELQARQLNRKLEAIKSIDMSKKAKKLFGITPKESI